MPPTLAENILKVGSIWKHKFLNDDYYIADKETPPRFIIQKIDRGLVYYTFNPALKDEQPTRMVIAGFLGLFTPINTPSAIPVTPPNEPTTPPQEPIKKKK